MCNYNISTFKTELRYFKLISIKKNVLSLLPCKEKIENISNNYLHKKIIKNINEYLHARSVFFDFTAQPNGSQFQKIVWQEIRKIKYGKTQTYNDLALKLNTSARAIGNACSKNKCLFLIPCHRIICSDGSVGGFILGSKVKKRLIKLEKYGK